MFALCGTPAPAPNVIDGDAGQKNTHTGKRVAGIFEDSVGDDEPRDRDECDRGEWMAWNTKRGGFRGSGGRRTESTGSARISAPKCEYARRRQAEENEIHGHDVIQN